MALPSLPLNYDTTNPLNQQSISDKTQSNLDFLEEYNEAINLWEANCLEECITKARALLARPSYSRYYRMKLFILLGLTIDDRNEAYEHLSEAEGLWHMIRRWFPVGADETADEILDEIRECLDDSISRFEANEPKWFTPRDIDKDFTADSDEEDHMRAQMEELELYRDRDLNGDAESVQVCLPAM